MSETGRLETPCVRSSGSTRALGLIVVGDIGGDLETLLSSVVREYADNPRWHFLYVDGASSSISGQAAARWLEADRISNADILNSPISQGQGGYQKLGFRYAIEAGFDLVVKLSGDVQTASKLLTCFLEVFERTGADVILGSPTPEPTETSSDAVSYDRDLGSRALTFLQALITGRRLGDYQSRIRAYSTDFLRSIPFEINTNDRHFDTEILLQAINAGADVEEVDVPLQRRGSTGRGRGFKYAVNELRTTIAYRMHRFGMLCSLKYRQLGSNRYRDKTWVPFSSHARALEVVRRAGPRSLLDIGCGPGHVAKLCEAMGVRVTGIDRESPLPGSVSDFHQWDLDRTPLPVDALAFDMVLILDVIEHLANPEDFLVSLRNASDRSASEEPTRVVITTPNVAFASIRLNLLLGRFNYAERGILDITHKRLFTRRSLLSTLEDCGYRAEWIGGIGAPFDAVMGGRIGRFLGIVSGALARLWPAMFAFQFLVVCRPLPGVRQLLSESRRVSADSPFHPNRSSN